MAINLPKLFDNGKHNILCIDPSGSHMAYAICELDLVDGNFTILNAGMIWTKASYSRPERLSYMQAALNVMINNPPYKEHAVDAVVTESFFSNPKQLTGGTAIVPTINAFIEMAADDAGIKFQEIGATTWRSIIGVKADKSSGKRDYKEPAKRYVELFTKLPETVPSNLDMRPRKLPHDLTDVLAIALSIAKYHNCARISFDQAWAMPHGYLLRFMQITKGDIK